MLPKCPSVELKIAVSSIFVNLFLAVNIALACELKKKKKKKKNQVILKISPFPYEWKTSSTRRIIIDLSKINFKSTHNSRDSYSYLLSYFLIILEINSKTQDLWYVRISTMKNVFGNDTLIKILHCCPVV